MGTDKEAKPSDQINKLLFEKDRLETFNRNWKELKGFKYCKPDNFAAAGFYNFSSSTFPDNVKCFACEKELSDWEKDDDPWAEHVKRGSKCPFVIFKSKENITVQDFLDLYFNILKSKLNNFFDNKKNILQDNEKFLLKKIGGLSKAKK